jgi:uncharacterized damage-inducible protein DinB
MMSDIPFFCEQLRKGHSDDPWHGPALTDLLADATAGEAAAHPVPGAHSVWEVVLHLISWQNEVRRRLGGKPPSLPEEGDWPEPADLSETAWRRDRERLAASLSELIEDLSGRPEEILDHPGGSLDRDPALGTGVTFRGMINGLIQHNAYHGGQIALLRKALRRRQ